MDISSEIKDSITVVRLEGNLDTNTSTDAQVYLNKAINEGASKVVVCFETVDFVSSAGLRVLRSQRNRLRDLRDFRLQHNPERVPFRGRGARRFLSSARSSVLRRGREVIKKAAAETTERASALVLEGVVL
jgi:anti-anti-sigma factor